MALTKVDKTLLETTGTADATTYLRGDGSWAAVPTAEGVPSGCILMWSGAISAIPSGWVICDGANSTPNLTSRFVIHADADSGGTYDKGATGGSTTSGAHTLLTAEMPSHAHNLQLGHDGEQEGAMKAGRDYRTAYSTLALSSTGGGGSHSHGSTIPPYYALAYIMKT